MPLLIRTLTAVLALSLSIAIGGCGSGSPESTFAAQMKAAQEICDTLKKIKTDADVARYESTLKRISERGNRLQQQFEEQMSKLSPSEQASLRGQLEEKFEREAMAAMECLFSEMMAAGSRLGDAAMTRLGEIMEDM
jgi:hypothetical protein